MVQVKNGLIVGTLYFANGDKHEGLWKNDMRNGKGVYYYADGRKVQGEWKNNKLQSKA